MSQNQKKEESLEELFKKYGLSDEEIELYAQYAIVYANEFANRENAYHALG